MPRRVLLLLKHRLDRSPLPLSDRVRLELERELLDLLIEDGRREFPRLMLAESAIVPITRAQW